MGPVNVFSFIQLSNFRANTVSPRFFILYFLHLWDKGILPRFSRQTSAGMYVRYLTF